MSSFFYFSQNNSGGHFDLTDKLTHHVVIEANSPDHANSRLQDLGGYFDGCSSGRDCSCCGDRWYPIRRDDKGDDVPTIYGKPVSSDPKVVGSWMTPGRNAVVHYLDGRVEWF